MYSKTVMDHFKKPRNVGVIEGADGVGEIGNDVPDKSTPPFTRLGRRTA